MKIIPIPNYLLNFSYESQLKLANFFAYSMSISSSYYLKTKDNFYKLFSSISYNPYMHPAYYSTSKKYKNCRKCFFFKYIVLYKVYENCVDILNIFHYRSNYSKVV